jgi:glucose/arabinose dehydrogenase
MTPIRPLKCCAAAIVACAFVVTAAAVMAQERAPAPPTAADQDQEERLTLGLSNTPQILQTSTGKIRVVPIKGLAYPWAIAFLPDGTMLVSEKGRTTIRAVRNGVLDPKPITGLPQGINFWEEPQVRFASQSGGVDIALHPQYAENKLIYFAFWKPLSNARDEVRTAILVRARYDGGTELKDVRQIFESNSWTDAPAATRIVFGRDGKIYMVIGAAGFVKEVGHTHWAQDPGQHAGKVLRLNDDGSVPSDNPFVGKPGYKPEIYALGIRNSLGLVVHPVTGEIWEHENGPQGGDEVNIIKAGKNYGWPLVTYGRAYTNDADGKISGLPPPSIQPPTTSTGLEEPFTFYKPSIAPSGMAFYTGDKFPLWRGNLFVGGLGGTQLSRITFNRLGLENRREALLVELRQRIREVRQGPDGFLYLTTDMRDGAILRIEPVRDEG